MYVNANYLCQELTINSIVFSLFFGFLMSHAFVMASWYIESDIPLHIDNACRVVDNLLCVQKKPAQVIPFLDKTSTTLQS